METKKRALGRGLEELFNSEQLDFNSLEEKIVDTTPKEEIIEIDINELRSNPYQPRKVFDEEKLVALPEFINKYSSDFIEQGKEYIEQASKATRVVRIEIEHLTGKRKDEK